MCNADPVTMAGRLKVTLVQAVETTVVPGGKPGPNTDAPANTASHPVTVAMLLPIVVFTSNKTLVLGGTEGVFQLPLTTANCPAGAANEVRQGGCARTLVFMHVEAAYRATA